MTGGNSNGNVKKIETLLADTKWDNTDKFGEGDFALRLTVEDEDIKVELVDKSNFNGGKEYVEGLSMGGFKTGKQPPLFEVYAADDKGTVSTTLSYISLVSVVAKDKLATGLTTNIEIKKRTDITVLLYYTYLSIPQLLLWIYHTS